jgi:hypothetical protein
VGRSWFPAQWLGVHAQDTLPPVGRDGVGIANTGLAPPAGASVGHWVAYCDSDGRRAFSDPLGAVGVQQRAGLAARFPSAHWSDDDAEMAVDESICGCAALAACAVGTHSQAEFLRV